MENSESDLKLIKRSLSGDYNAYGELINTYNRRIFNIVYRMTNNYQEAEDITQEAFIKTYKKLEEFKIQYKFFSWICTIALNITRNRLKRKSILKFFSLDKPRKAGDEDEQKWEMADGSLTPEEKMIKKEEHKKINELVNSLPLKYREIFLMRNLEDMSYSDIAKVSGLPMGTVEIRLHRANKLIAKEYMEYSEGVK